MSYGDDAPNILVIRLGLLGDMMCTTPMLAAIKSRFPKGRLCILSNEYNRPVVARNPNVDKLYTYVHSKGRQRNPRPGFFASLIDAWRLKRDLKREDFDWVVVCNAGFHKASVRIAQKLRPAKIISATREDGSYDYHVDFPLRGLLDEPIEHEVVRTFRLLTPIGITPDQLPLHLTLSPDPVSITKIQRRLQALPEQLNIVVHISARDSQREWPIANFAQLIQSVNHALPNAHFWIVYTPADNSRANDLQHAIGQTSHQLISPETTEELIAVLALSLLVVCQEGGILHLAAGLQKPVVGLFENTAEKVGAWYPWGVPYAIVTAEPREPISAIKTQPVIDGVLALARH